MHCDISHTKQDGISLDFLSFHIYVLPSPSFIMNGFEAFIEKLKVGKLESFVEVNDMLFGPLASAICTRHLKEVMVTMST